MGSISKGAREYLESQLAEAIAQYTQEHPLSKKGHEEACKYMPGGNTRTVLYTNPFPLTIASGSGCQLTTVDGQTYVDFLGEYTAGIYGHSNPVIRKAIETALDHGWNYAGQSQKERELAKIVCERFPVMERVRFVNSGTEANMMAIATAIACTGKKKILVFKKGYHGSTISGRVPDGKPSINLPHEFVVGHYNDVLGTEALVDSLPENSLAAILVEPMIGSGGCYTATKEFLLSIRDLASKHQAILIFDEVMSSRLSYHGYSERMGVYPDMMTVGKWVGGGMSFGAFGGRQYLMDLFDPRKGQLEHAGTFNNNVFSMSAGVAGCTLLNKRTLDMLNYDGDELRERIEAVFLDIGLIRKHPQAKNYYIGGRLPDAPVSDDMHDVNSQGRPPKMYIKGVGSLMTMHFSGPDRTLLQGLFWHHMLKHGIYMAQRGFVALNIELKEEHYQKFVDAVRAFVEEWIEALKW